MNSHHSSPITRHPFVVALVFAAALMLAGCDYFGFTPVKDIAAAPGQFEGKEVKVRARR